MIKTRKHNSEASIETNENIQPNLCSFIYSLTPYFTQQDAPNNQKGLVNPNIPEAITQTNKDIQAKLMSMLIYLSTLYVFSYTISHVPLRGETRKLGF